MDKIELFLAYLTFEKRFSVHTVEAYKLDLSQFLKFIEVEFEMKLEEVTHHQIRSWVVKMKENGKSHKTIHRKISSIKSFYKQERRLGNIIINPTSVVKLPKLEKRIPHFIKHSELNTIKDDLREDKESFELLRDDMIILLLLSTGMRRSELIGLKETDYSEGLVKVLGKRNKERVIPLPESIADSLDKYLIVKRQKFPNGIDELLVTNTGEKLYEKFVYRIVNKYLASITTSKKKSPHVLRHSYATELLNNGADLSSIKDLLGHSSLAATQVYTHSSMEKIKEIYKSAHPRSTKN
jgi:integrase/recombinase XerC